MSTEAALTDFVKEAPVGFSFCNQSCSGCYKYCLEGKGCTLGVLFESSCDVYLEWLTENGEPVAYPPRLRYKSWPKREVMRLLRKGVYEPVSAPPFDATRPASSPDPSASSPPVREDPAPDALIPDISSTDESVGRPSFDISSN